MVTARRPWRRTASATSFASSTDRLKVTATSIPRDCEILGDSSADALAAGNQYRSSREFHVYASTLPISTIPKRSVPALPAGTSTIERLVTELCRAASSSGAPAATGGIDAPHGRMRATGGL